MIEAPIVAQVENNMREKITKEVEERLKTRFILERWHVLALLIALSLISSIFREEIMYVSFFLGACLCFDTYIGKESKSSVKPSTVSQITGIVTEGENDED